MLGKFAGPLTENVVPLAKNVLASSATMASASAIKGAIQRKMCEWGVVRAGKRTTSVISNEDIGDIRIIKSPGNSGVLLDRVSETIKREIRRREGRFLGMLLGALGASVLGNMLIGKGVIRAGKGVLRAGKAVVWIIWIKSCTSALSFKQYQIY